ncbi:MAG TPA: gliding-motility protein MglA [Firmicutes bacterium]|nr:gliding-motility protein MglA [Bacillota bacterium]
MPTIDHANKEISCKIVYYGPGLCGKTTNLELIHRDVPGQSKTNLVSLATEKDRTLFFDFLPVTLGEIKGFKIKFQLYTVPGQVYYNATRKLVLSGVDGVVFVADSQRSKFRENVDMMENLRENLLEYRINLDELPLVLQYNKRDLPDIVPVSELRQALNTRGIPEFEAVAVQGKGVRETLRSIATETLSRVGRRAASTASKQKTPPTGTGSRTEPAKPSEQRRSIFKRRSTGNG